MKIGFMKSRLLFSLTLKSLVNRKFTVLLTIFSICVSVSILLGVETVRTEAKKSFTSTVSGTDLLVGARSGSVQLLLYSVFRIGNATNNIDWRSYQEISKHPAIAWSIPISLGDSHRGYRVMGTNTDYFEYFRYGADQPLVLSEGQPFKDVYDAVIGAEVAKALGYTMGSEMVLAHGTTDTHFARHEDKPFRVVGVLAPTGTPVDRTIHVSLQGIEALHVDWQSGTRSRQQISADEARNMDLEPKQITAFLLGLESKMATFKIQRAINNYRKEALLAVLPGVALGELWQLIGVAEKALLFVSVFVLINSFVGLLTVVLTSLNERRRELAILRSLGCRPFEVFVLLNLESILCAIVGAIAGTLLYYLALYLGQGAFQSAGLSIPLGMLSAVQWLYILAIVVFSAVIGILPGYRAYRYSLIDGMATRL